MAFKLKRTVVLVGLMGAGKSSVGAHLSDLLSAPFFDSDDEISNAAGMSIPEIFERFGEEDFRRGETAVLSRLIRGKPCILATGGGAFVSPDNRKIIAAGGVSVWLDVALDVLWSRVQDKPGRPLLATPDPKAALAELFEARRPAYAQADLSVGSLAEDSHDDVARAILSALDEFGESCPDRAAFEKR